VGDEIIGIGGIGIGKYVEAVKVPAAETETMVLGTRNRRHMAVGMGGPEYYC
jgi:proteasome assembly chaperone (PAC2) family protein